MNAIRFTRLRTRYAIAAATVAIGVACAIQAPGLLQAFAVVGTDAQLPLERIATAPGEAASFTDVSEPLRGGTREPAHVQPSLRSWKEGARGGRSNERAVPHAAGYRRVVTSFKYWT